MNYTGHPFMESLRSNRPLFALLTLMAGGGVGMASGWLAPLNEMLELVELPPALRESLVSTALVTAASCYAIERVSQWAFVR